VYNEEKPYHQLRKDRRIPGIYPTITAAINAAYSGFQAYASFNALVVVQSSAATPIGYNTQNVEYLRLEQKLEDIYLSQRRKYGTSSSKFHA
jgi:hypothetical protein